jgi:hypothetical protein
LKMPHATDNRDYRHQKGYLPSMEVALIYCSPKNAYSRGYKMVPYQQIGL